jgi:LuxR family transcriptional regulator, regulator of acetate metabolism
MMPPVAAADGSSQPGQLPVGHERLRELMALQRRLRGVETIAELLTVACDWAPQWCGFTRALIVSVDGDRLNPSLLAALSDPASDALRRRVLADPVTLSQDSAEAELIRQSESHRPARAVGPSVLQSALGLEQLAFGAVMPEDKVLALLMVERAEPAVSEQDRDVVQFFAHMLGLSLERVFLRSRMRELATELRHMTASSLAVMREALESPVALPADYGAGPVFANPYPVGEQPALRSRAGGLAELLTARELQIAEQMVGGRSNREIAAELHLSPETIKGYVARVLRKLGASNRVDAVSRYLRLAAGDNDR